MKVVNPLTPIVKLKAASQQGNIITKAYRISFMLTSCLTLLHALNYHFLWNSAYFLFKVNESCFKTIQLKEEVIQMSQSNEKCWLLKCTIL